MPNPTPAQDMTSVLTTFVNTAWPGTNADQGYYSPVTLLPVAAASLPTPTDWMLYHVVQSILNCAPQDFTFNRAQSNADRKALYNEIISRLTNDQTNLTALISALTTYVGTLP